MIKFYGKTSCSFFANFFGENVLKITSVPSDDVVKQKVQRCRFEETSCDFKACKGYCNCSSNFLRS
jgi:hypothetical protein